MKLTLNYERHVLVNNVICNNKHEKSPVKLQLKENDNILVTNGRNRFMLVEQQVIVECGYNSNIPICKKIILFQISLLDNPKTFLKNCFSKRY